MRKFVFSKCPACKKRGIKAFNKVGKSTPILVCRYCGKKFRMNIVLSIIVQTCIPIFVGGCYFFSIDNDINIPHWIYYVVAIALLLIFEYFAPLEKVDD